MAKDLMGTRRKRRFQAMIDPVAVDPPNAMPAAEDSPKAMPAAEDSPKVVMPVEDSPRTAMPVSVEAKPVQVAANEFEPQVEQESVDANAKQAMEMLTFELPRSVAEEFRGATMMAGPRLVDPDGEVVTSQRAMLTLMIVEKLEELRAKYNDGEPFPRVPRRRRR